MTPSPIRFCWSALFGRLNIATAALGRNDAGSRIAETESVAAAHHDFFAIRYELEAGHHETPWFQLFRRALDIDRLKDTAESHRLKDGEPQILAGRHLTQGT